MRLEATEIPDASLMVVELPAASAMHAYTTPQIIWESANHAWVKPRSSISLVSLIARCGLVNMRVPNSIACYCSLFPVAEGRTVVAHARPNQAVVGGLLETVRDPSCRPTQRED